MILFEKIKSMLGGGGKSVLPSTPQFSCEYTLFGGDPGSGFGAWAVNKKFLSSKSVVYSVGIGDNISFDLDLIRSCGVRVCAFDPTPNSLEWLKKQNVPPEFKAFPYGVSAKDGTATFYPHRNKDWVAHSMIRHKHADPNAIQVEVRRLSTIMRMLGHDRIDLLKLDIEGGEYDVIDDLVESKIPVRQLLVEFHHRFRSLSSRMTLSAIQKLNASGMKTFYVSPTVEEFSFLAV